MTFASWSIRPRAGFGKSFVFKKLTMHQQSEKIGIFKSRAHIEIDLKD